MEDQHTKPPLLYIDQKLEFSPIVSQSSFYSAIHDKKQNQNKDQIIDQGESGFQTQPIKDKLNYLLNTKETIPNIKCRFFINNDTVIGTVEELSDDQVKIKVMDTFQRINVEITSIKDIQIVSF